MNDKEYEKDLLTLIENSMIKKVNEYEQSVMKNHKFNDLYELNNLIIHRHLLIKTFEEINKELKTDNRQFRIDFDDNAYKYFNDLNYKYFKTERCIADDSDLSYFKMREDMYTLDGAIKNNTDDKELKFMPKRIKSKLPIYRIGLY